MSDEYTPTTGEIRNAFTFWRRAFIVRKSWYDESLLLEQTNAEFTRWLESHDREVAEKAWDEGFDAGERDVMEHEAQGFSNPCIANPYREGATS